MQPSDIPVLVRELISVDPRGRTGIAAQLGVSASTVGRWLSGATRPQPSIEGQIRKLAGNLPSSSVHEPLPLYGWYEPQREEYLRSVVATTLQKTREALHRSGSLSSRHEALDEISKLLFAHIISLQTGGHGISARLVKGVKSPAEALKSFVYKIYSQHLPVSLAYTLKTSDFHLRLKDSENVFADEIISCFDCISNPEFSVAFSGPDGNRRPERHFLGNSWQIPLLMKRNWGNTLTPTEIVRFMSRLGINSLSKQDFELLCHPKKLFRFWNNS